MMRKGRLARLARLGGMAVGLAGDATAAATDLVAHSTDEAAERLHRHAAQRMLKVLGEMKGLPLKAGQMFSYIDEILPPEHKGIYNEMLGKLQVHTPPMEWEAVREVFVAEFNGKQPEQVFATFDREPIAAASIGQVYRATLEDGSPVVVKIQYPGVVDALRSDLDNAETMVTAMSAVMPKADLAHFVEDITSRIMEECDYVAEAEHQRTFRAAWQGVEQVIIPRTIDELCTGRVLVSEYLDGQEWAAMLESASPTRKNHYGMVIFRFVFESLFRHAMFNGDPHPGNYLFYPDGRVAFIDYGCVQRYSVEQEADFDELRHAVLAGSRGPAFQSLLGRVLGFPDEVDPEMKQLLEDYMHLTFLPITAPQPYTFTREYTRQLMKKGMDAKMVMTKKMLTGRNVNVFDSEHRGVAFLGRINFGLGSILTTLGTVGDFRSIIEEID